MDINRLRTLSRADIPHASKSLTNNDIDVLVDFLTKTDDRIRYHAFLLLKENSQDSPKAYSYWDTFKSKLGSDNSYQRSIGLMLIAENAKWDKNGKLEKTIDEYLGCCTDEKFITARQAIQGLAKIVTATKTYNEKIKQYMTNFPFEKYPKNQQGLLKKDVSNIIKNIDR
jgi:hypothetical protein